MRRATKPSGAAGDPPGLVEQACRPTFLVCSERSGSNLIRSILNAHPYVYAPEPIHLGAFWERHGEFGDLQRDTNWRALLTAIVEFLDEWSGTVDPSLQLSMDELWTAAPRRDFGSLYGHVYTRGLAGSGKSCLFIKENHTAQRAGLFVPHFPQTRLVYQVRDPRDFVASCKRMRQFKYGSTEAALAVWCADQRAALELVDQLGSSRVFSGSYETLIHQPERYLERLCAFIGVGFDPGMLEFHRTADAKRAAAHEAWRNLGRPIMRDNSGHYAQTLTAEEIGLVEAHAHELMTRLGYDVERTPDPTVDGTGLSLPGEGEPHRRRVQDGSSSAVLHRVIDRHLSSTR